MARVWIPMPKDTTVEEWVAYVNAFREAQRAEKRHAVADEGSLAGHEDPGRSALDDADRA